MPWKDHLKRLKGEWDNIVNPGQQDQQQQAPPQQQQQPLQHDGGTPAPVSGQELFHADGPVVADWEPKLGNSDGWGNQELEHYTDSPENSFYTHDGKLVLRAIANNAHPDPTRRYTSARLVHRQPLGRDAGVLTGILSSPCAPGIWPAFWLLPQEPFSWPTDGEIDIAETWNGDGINHSCLHWGQHNEPQKHRVCGTHLPDMHARSVRYDFAWRENGRMIWYLDGRPVMKGQMPKGARPLREFVVLLNIAMGGNVCAGQTPADGTYDLVVDMLFLASEPENGGWKRFDHDWSSSPEGKHLLMSVLALMSSR